MSPNPRPTRASRPAIRPAVIALSLTLASGVPMSAPTGCVCSGQSPATSHTPVVSGLAIIDTDTCWSLRSHSPVTLSTTVIRLADVASPVDHDIAAWKRLEGAVVGLIPVGQSRVVIDRDRLQEVILRGEATPRTMQWTGPDRIEVRYQPERTDADDVPVEASAPIQPAPRPEPPPSAAQTTAAEIQLVASESAATDQLGSVPAPAATASLQPSAAYRLKTWIDLAMRRHAADVMQRYRIELKSSAANTAALAELSRASGILHAGISPATLSQFDAIAQSGSEQPLDTLLMVSGRSYEGPIDVSLEVSLQPHPLVVVLRGNVRRGGRITVNDLQLKPLEIDKWQDNYSGNPADFVGLEISGVVRVGQPLPIDAVARPMLVRRGELIELRVLGGGLSVTTNAKALADGHHLELIDVETLQPKRRLVGRVAATGIVEIVTRAPSVR